MLIFQQYNNKSTYRYENKIADSWQCRTQQVGESWASVRFLGRMFSLTQFNELVKWRLAKRAFAVFFCICLFHNCENFP